MKLTKGNIIIIQQHCFDPENKNSFINVGLLKRNILLFCSVGIGRYCRHTYNLKILTRYIDYIIIHSVQEVLNSSYNELVDTRFTIKTRLLIFKV